jgi:hypothetical protein
VLPATCCPEYGVVVADNLIRFQSRTNLEKQFTLVAFWLLLE